jgi:glucokinase
VIENDTVVDLDAAVSRYLDETGAHPRAATLAIAGPIDGDEVALTNRAWRFRRGEFAKRFGFSHLRIVNDFEAIAWALRNLAPTETRPLGKPVPPREGVKVVLGPGTGLGVAGLVHALDAWIPVPGEGGHVDLGPRSKRDYEIFPHIETIEGRVSAEQILCGRGLVNLYNAICIVDGIQPTMKDPADITSHALAGTDKAAIETVSLFATYLGRVAGDMAMVFMARGGVYLSGGISQKIIPALKKPEFRIAFEDKAPHTALLRTIPTYVVTHPLAALAGLSSYARMPANFGVSTEGRRWRR